MAYPRIIFLLPPPEVQYQRRTGGGHSDNWEVDPLNFPAVQTLALIDTFLYYSEQLYIVLSADSFCLSVMQLMFYSFYL